MRSTPGVDIIGIKGCATPQECLAWFEDPEREKNLLQALSRFLSDEGDKAVLGQIGAAWDGEWHFWNRGAK